MDDSGEDPQVFFLSALTCVHLRMCTQGALLPSAFSGVIDFPQVRAGGQKLGQEIKETW